MFSKEWLVSLKHVTLNNVEAITSNSPKNSMGSDNFFLKVLNESEGYKRKCTKCRKFWPKFRKSFNFFTKGRIKTRNKKKIYSLKFNWRTATIWVFKMALFKKRLISKSWRKLRLVMKKVRIQLKIILFLAACPHQSLFQTSR